MATKEIVSVSADDGITTTPKTINNLISSARNEKLGSRTAIHTLLDDLKTKGYAFDYKLDKDGRLSHLFSAYPLSIILAHCYCDTAVMDCTYKTNRYKMPLLDVVSCTNNTFTICHAFILLSVK